MKHSNTQITNLVCIAYNNLSDDVIIDARSNLSKEAFLEEFQRIIIGISRRSGKTTAAYELLDLFPNSLLINGLRNSNKPYMYKNILDKVVDIQEVGPELFKDNRLDLVIIDNAKQLKIHQIRKIYRDINFTSELVVELL